MAKSRKLAAATKARFQQKAVYQKYQEYVKKNKPFISRTPMSSLQTKAANLRVKLMYGDKKKPTVKIKPSERILDMDKVRNRSQTRLSRADKDRVANMVGGRPERAAKR